MFWNVPALVYDDELEEHRVPERTLGLEAEGRLLDLDPHRVGVAGVGGAARRRIEIVVDGPDHLIARNVRTQHVDRVAFLRRVRVGHTPEPRGRAVGRRAVQVLAPRVVEQRIEQRIGRRLLGAALDVRGVLRVPGVADDLVRDVLRLRGVVEGRVVEHDAGRELLAVLRDREPRHAVDERAHPEPRREHRRLRRSLRVDEPRVPGREVIGERAEVRHPHVDRVDVDAPVRVERLDALRGLGLERMGSAFQRTRDLRPHRRGAEDGGGEHRQRQ
jgi:hypothetical protein